MIPPAKRRWTTAIALILGLSLQAQHSLGETQATASGATIADADAGELASPRALRDLLERATRERAPVVALFSRLECPWCVALRREHLLPLAQRSQAQGIRVVEFRIDDAQPFQPRETPPSHPLLAAHSPAELARRLGIRAVPTVVFLDRTGEIAPRLVGYGSPDFYGAYLEERIGQARQAIRPPP